MNRRMFSKLAASLLLTPFIGFQSEQQSRKAILERITNQLGFAHPSGMILETVTGFRATKNCNQFEMEYVFQKIDLDKSSVKVIPDGDWFTPSRIPAS